MKICTKCKIEKEFEQFQKDKQKKDGFCSYCKDCKNSRNKERYLSNPTSFKENQKRYNSKESSREGARMRNKKCYINKKISMGEEAFFSDRKEKRIKYKSWEVSYSKQYREENRVSLLLKEKSYRETNYEVCRERSKNWAKRNISLCRKYCQERNARKLNATPSWANQKYISLFFEIAKLEEERTNRKCHVDHIVPLKSQLVCGLHTEQNLQVLFAKDNIVKGNRFWPDMPDDIQEVLQFYGLK